MVAISPRRQLTRFGAWLLLLSPQGYDLLNVTLRSELPYRFGRPHEKDFRGLSRLIKQTEPVVIDVGGNVGQSILSLLCVLPRSKIFTFEPNPSLLPRLEEIVKKSSQVTLLPFGLADQEGTSDLYVPSYKGNVLTGLGSFSQDTARGWLNHERVMWFNPDNLKISSYRVSIRTLDSFALQPDVIKIDVQGLEPDVISGGIETIRTHRPVIMAECLSVDCSQLGLDGYQVAEFDGSRFYPLDGPPRRLNQFLIPIEKLPK